MDKNEQKLKIEELKRAMHDKDFDKAVEIAEALDFKKIKDNNFLCLMADAYEVNHDYDSAKKVLLAAYENTNTGRHIAYKLCLLSIKTKEFALARDYYEDFIEMAPRDTSRYVLKYRMAKAQGKPIEELITILEEYVNLDMEEKWAYELAKLYDEVEDKEKCVDICDEISLWFSEGKYVFRAMDLKKKYSPLTPVQQEKYDENKRKVKAEKEGKKEKKRTPFEVNLDMIQDIPEVKIEPQIADEDIQAVVADGMKEIFEENEDVAEELGKIDEKPTEKADENFGETKIFGNNAGEMEEIILQLDESEEPEVIETEVPLEVIEEEEVEILPEQLENEKEEEFAEKINDIGGVADILRQLQSRGILKAETVEQAVNIIDEASGGKEEQKDGSKINETLEDKENEEPESVTEISDEEKSLKDEANEEINETPVELKEEISFEEEINSTQRFEIPKTFMDVRKENEEQPSVGITEEKDKIEDSEVPVFDLSFESAVNHEVEDNIDINSDLKVKDNPSAKIEIIAGAGIVEEGELKEKTESQQELKEDVAIEENKESNLPEQKQPAVHEVVSLKQKLEENSFADTKEDLNEEGLDIEPRIVLTDEELTTFKNYLNVEGFESNIKDVLQELITNYTPNGKSSEGNIIIMGNEKTGKTTLAIEIIKLVNSKRGRRNRKLAKINAEALNRRGFRNALNKLLGSDLIIENAEKLGAMTLSEIIDVSGMFTDDMLIILEGETDGMERILQESPRVSQVFNHVVRIREYDIKEWVEYGKNYAGQKGYRLDELANLAFYKAIDDFFGTNKGIGRNDVESIVDEAIAKSGRLGRKLTGIFSSKKDDEGYDILMESDFNV